MLIGKCINPDLIRVLSLCGHGDKILIADGNYPLDSKSGEAKKVYLGVTPGLPAVTDLLATLQSVITIEMAAVMEPDDGTAPAIFGEFKRMLNNMELSKLDRHEFYDACCMSDVKLAISTGEERTFANLLLTIGVA